jgi:murein DD-endopeptidase MepM/ murein hydrolase activator NlpD
MARGSGRGGRQRAREDFDDEYRPERYSGEYDAAGYDEDDDRFPPRRGGALVPRGDSAGLPVPYDEDDTGPFIIPGSGLPMGQSLLPPRQRPLFMRLAVVGLVACVLFSGLFAVAPLNGSGVDAATGGTPFQALSGAVVWHARVDYVMYVATQNDTVESIAAKFNCQIGGIYELNNMLSGQELQVGQAYKIPTDPNYGMYFRPASYYVTGYGATTYTDSPWTSLAGLPPTGALCGPAPQRTGADENDIGSYNLASFQLKDPNPGAAFVRGFSWYHNGDDLANPEGTPIHAAQAGEVIFAGWDPGGGGNAIKINNCNHISTFYCHMDQLLVPVHQMVNVGDVIGLEGSTGNSTGPHLHFTVEWNNNPVDPLQFYGWSTYNITH